jgi:hypothetical protein
MALKKYWRLIVIALGMPVLLAASSPKMLLSWRNPNYSGGQFTNILVLALNGKAENRAEFEDELAAAITRPGLQATQSYVFLARPNATPIRLDDLKAIIREQHFDAILVARLTKAEKKTTYVPGQSYTPYPYFTSLDAYYGAVYPVVYSPGYMVKERNAQVQTNIYSTAKPDGELVWTGTTNTFDANSPMKVIKDLIKIVVRELEKQKVIEVSVISDRPTTQQA